MSPLAAIHAWLTRRTTRRAAARPCCLGRCTTGAQQLAARIPAQRTREES